MAQKEPDLVYHSDLFDDGSTWTWSHWRDVSDRCEFCGVPEQGETAAAYRRVGDTRYVGTTKGRGAGGSIGS